MQWGVSGSDIVASQNGNWPERAASGALCRATSAADPTCLLLELMEQPSPNPRMTSDSPLGAAAEGLLAPANSRTWLDVTGSLLGHAGELDPLSVDVLARALHHFSHAALRYDGPLPADKGLVGVFDGRVYLNVSALLGLLRPGSLAQWVSEVDPLAAPDVMADGVSSTDDLRELQLLPGLLMRGARALASAVAGQIQPAWSRGVANEAWDAWEARIDRRAARPVGEDGLVAWVDRLLVPTAQLVVDELIPRIALATTACRAVREPFRSRPECAPLLDAVPRALDGSSVCRLVLDLADVAQCAADTPERDAAWAALMHRHGHRGERELSLLVPRLSESSAAVDMVAVVAGTPDLASRWECAVQARKLAVSTLAADLPGPLERTRFLAAAQVVGELGGLSDAPLAALVRVLAPIRAQVRVVLHEACAAGQVDWQDVPHLSLAGVDALARGEAPRFVKSESLPGRRAAPRVPTSPVAVVGGQARGIPISASAALSHSGSLAGHILVTDILAPWTAPLVAACAGVVITGTSGYGPAVAVARAFGRPCVLTGRPLIGPSMVLVDGDTPEVRGLS